MYRAALLDATSRLSSVLLPPILLILLEQARVETAEAATLEQSRQLAESLHARPDARRSGASAATAEATAEATAGG